MSTRNQNEVLTITSNLINKRPMLACVLLTISILFNFIETPVLAASASNQKTKLVVLLIADQFPTNYFLHCADKFQANGLRQLIDNGANFTACRYLGATNQTACNLATIVTGAYPSGTGVVGNEWYDRRKQTAIRVITDENSPAGAEESAGGSSLLLGNTVGDELKVASNGLSHIVSLSTARNDALLLAGKSKDQAFWWDCRTGTFTGQSRLSKSVPGWAKSFNDKRFSEQFLGKNWQPSGRTNVFASADTYEPQKSDSEHSFGYMINSDSKIADESFYTRFQATPWANQMLVDFAKDIVEHESLGQHDTPDMLTVSFPSFELVGKTYGPYSNEAHDLVLRFDQSLADLFESLDEQVGLSNCLVIFTAGHGAAAPAQMLQAQGLEGGLVDAKAFRNQLNSSLSSKLGKANWIEAFIPPNLYLNLNAIDHSNFRQPDVEKLTAKLGHSIPGVAEIYTAFQFFMNQVPTGPQVDVVRRSYFWGRSGELYVVPKSGYVFTSESDGIADGSPYSYDSQVPLLLYGSQIKGGTYAGAVSPDDIAPTIANVLSITMPPFSEGRVLNEALTSSGKTKYVKTGK